MAGGCSLATCNLLKRNYMRDHSLEISCKFQSSFNKFGEEFVQRYKLQIVSLQLRLKGGTFEVFTRAVFRNIPVHMFKFSTELRNAEISPVPLLKIKSTTEALPEISQIIRTLPGNFCGGVSFQYSCRWLDLTARRTKKERWDYHEIGYHSCEISKFQFAKKCHNSFHGDCIFR